MTDHLISPSYTVLEIERMRKATYAVMFPLRYTSRSSGYYPGTGGAPGETEAKVEVQLRTYMLNGTRPEELEALAAERAAESEIQRRSYHETSYQHDPR